MAPDSGSSFSPAFSADGKHLVFASSSINFVESAKSGNRIDLFDYLGPGKPLGLLTPPNSEGYATLGESFPVGVANDRVVFLSTSPDLYPGATNLVQRLYSQSLYSVYRRLLARDIRGPAYDSLDIQVATLADNGQYVFYETAAVVLNGVTNISRPQIYRMSLDTLGSPELASFGPDGFSSDDRILTGMTVNKDGTMLAYVAQTATNEPVVVVNDLNGRTSLSFSVGSNPNPYDIYEINISSEGRHLMVRHTGEFPSVDHGVYWVNLASQEIISITRDLDGNYLGNDTSFASPILFHNGETVAFEVESTDLSSRKTVFWSREKGRFGMDGFMASVPAGYVEPSNSSQPVLSPDGKKLLFVSTTPHLVEGVADQMPHLYVRELASGKTILIDPSDLPPLSLNNFPAEIVFSPDSSRVAISIPRPCSIDQRPVLYVADLSLNTTTAVRPPGLDHLPR
ncbi:MAG TPA: hypothetical protein VMF06_15525, partial [Candidatus Limnocylindria bacterium]|nr:hypothetical protein [Candidatus Limnocylindria bacterium]